MNGCIIVREEAGAAIMSKRKLQGIYYCANTDVSDSSGLVLGRVGKGFLMEIMKSLAIRCGFSNAEQFSGRSCRKTSITKMAASGVPTSEMCASARYQSVKFSNMAVPIMYS